MQSEPLAKVTANRALGVTPLVLRSQATDI